MAHYTPFKLTVDNNYRIALALFYSCALSKPTRVKIIRCSYVYMRV